MKRPKGDEGHLPASEDGTGTIPEDESGGEDVHFPESEAGTQVDETDTEPQSWPGRDFGSIPPPG